MLLLDVQVDGKCTNVWSFETLRLLKGVEFPLHPLILDLVRSQAHHRYCYAHLLYRNCDISDRFPEITRAGISQWKAITHFALKISFYHWYFIKQFIE